MRANQPKTLLSQASNSKDNQQAKGMQEMQVPMVLLVEIRRSMISIVRTITSSTIINSNSNSSNLLLTIHSNNPKCRHIFITINLLIDKCSLV